MVWAGDAISGCQFFLQKKRYFPAAWKLFRIWKREEIPCQAPPLTGPIVFALCATALAWNLTDVALLIAIYLFRWIFAHGGSAHVATKTNHGAQ